MNRQILCGDVLEKLKEISDESIDCIISSPPYWGLRDYGVKGQLGLEPDFREYLKKMSLIMDQLKRVLKKTGTCWINLGDCYGSHRSNECNKMVAAKQEMNPIKGYTKSRIGIPERYYINCIDNGWIARNHIPWYKSNSMPSSVKDRFTNKWESIFFFAKNQKYYFNLDAVREPTISGKPKKPRNKKIDRKWKDVAGQSTQGIHRNRMKGESDWKEYLDNDSSKYVNNKQSNGQRIGKFRNKERWSTGSGWDEKNNCLGCGEPKSKHHSNHNKNINNGDTAEFTPCNPKGKNPGDVFFINPRPFPEAHFATFPIDLPVKILKCACPQKVCKKCGVPVENIMKPTPEYAKLLGKSWHNHKDDMGKGMTQDRKQKQDATASYIKAGEKTCDCDVGFESGIVLDPFFGAGTTAVAAEELGLQWIGIELNSEYVELARKRLSKYNFEKLEEFQTLS